jgi:hypothetical protein
MSNDPIAFLTNSADALKNARDQLDICQSYLFAVHKLPFGNWHPTAARLEAIDATIKTIRKAEEHLRIAVTCMELARILRDPVPATTDEGR